MTEREVEHDARPAGAFDPAASAGLFVGVSTFEDAEIARVPYAVDDAVDLAFLFALELDLVAPAKTVLLLAGEPQKRESRERLLALRAAGVREGSARQREVYRFLSEQAQATGPRGLLVLTVATHGLSDQGGDFFLATESLLARTQRTGVSVEEVFDEVSKANSGRALVLLDTCRERLTAETRGVRAVGMAASFEKAMAASAGVVVLSGTTLGGFSYDDPARENGVFTAAVLDGLRGQAPAGAEGWITVRALADYVHERVRAWVRKHRPGDVGKSQGIGRKVDGAAEGIPLAPHAGALEQREKGRARRAAALRQLAQVVSGSALLDGSHLDFVKKRLGSDEDGDEGGAEALIVEIEALDESARSQRGFRALLRELSEGAGTARVEEEKPVLPHEPVVVETVEAAAAVPRKDQVGRARGGRSSWWKTSTATRVAIGSAIFVGVLIGAWLWPKRVKPASETVEETPVAGTEAMGSEMDHMTSEAPAVEVQNTVEGPLGMRFRWVPSGTYKTGSPANEPGRYDDETQREVTLKEGFWLGETEVTQGQYSELFGDQPSKFKNCGANCPVENVNWYEAVEFANRLSAREKLTPCYDPKGPVRALGNGLTYTSVALDRGCNGYRLPTEEEWEIAARAGAKTALYTGGITIKGKNDAPELDAIAWYGGNSQVSYPDAFDCSGLPEKQFRSKRCGPHAVAQKRANAWGFFDMLGNVFEWTETADGSEGRIRVIRGGSWLSYARYVRSAYRSRYDPSSRWTYLGFRLARGQGLRSSQEAEP